MVNISYRSNCFLQVAVVPFLRLAKSRLRRLLACTRLRAQSSDPLRGTFSPGEGVGSSQRQPSVRMVSSSRMSISFMGLKYQGMIFLESF